MKNTKNRKQLQEKGVADSLHIEYGDKNVCIKFRFDGDPLNISKQENFSEKSVLSFVAKSYASSCLTLLKSVKDYSKKKTDFERKECIYHYLPALFCFRHYIELKLKYLYMCYGDESFNVSSHSLSDLLKELKNKNCQVDYFDDPITYVENLESAISSNASNDSFFRYLIDKDMNCKESLDIPIFEYDKIKKWIMNIEYKSSLNLSNKKIRELISSKENDCKQTNNP